MASYAIRHIPSGLLAQAKARAEDRRERLDDILIAMLAAYAEGRRSAGGQGRAAALSASERSAIARRAAAARWERTTAAQ